MTVSSTTVKKSYNGNGSTTAFTYDFLINTTAELKVIIRSSTGAETVKTISSHYNISDSSGSGTVTFTSGNIPASGETVILIRDTNLTQGTDYVENDPFPSASHESALDKLTLQVQEVQEEVDRAIKLSRTNTMTSTEFTVGATDRASKILAFDSTGEISVAQELGTFKGNWGASTTYAIRDIVKDTSTNNIFIALTAHTSSGSQPLTTNTDSAKWSLLVDAATATTSATAAASSATAAASSATTATTKASEAATSATNAATSETNASTSASTSSTQATNAASSATSAASSATTATTKASEASTSASNAATSATSASNSASTATTKASEASTSASNASTSASTASTQASTATTKASEAATSATNAATSASTATTQATNSSNSATASATSATNAGNSATAAANSAAAAANSFDDFDDKYLGSKSSNPTVDNDGNALVSGALYFNSTSNEMRVYDGANWIAASSAGTASLIIYEYTATANQTTFTGNDSNSASLSYSVNNIIVTLNGVTLDSSDYTATSGTSVVLGAGAAVNDLLNVYAFKSFTVAEVNAANINSGLVPTARLGSGTASSSTFLAGDQTFKTITGTTINNNADNRLITGSGTANTLEGEANLTFDGTHLNLGDNQNIQIGASNDLQLFHNASDSFVQDAGTGVLKLRGNSKVEINQYSDDEKMAVFNIDGAAELYHNGVKKIETTSGGVQIGTGAAENTSVVFDGNAQDYYIGIEDSSDRLRIGAGSTVGNGSGIGITSTGVTQIINGLAIGGTGTANTLDDYEEGDFTATLRGATEPSTKLTTTGKYVKIGRNVNFQLGFEAINASSYGGAVDIYGLPFANISGVRNMATFAHFDAITYSGYVVGEIGGGGTQVTLQDVRSNTSWTSALHKGSSGAYYWLTGCYQTN